MTKTLRLLAVALVAAVAVPAASASAQDAAFGQGTKILDLGIVTDPTGLGASFEIGLKELAPNLRLGIGGALSYQSESFAGVDFTTTWVAGLANVHYAIPSVPQLDLFGGVALGIVRGSIDGGLGESISDSDVGFGINLGARYMFTPKLGATVRLGIEDVPDLFLGVSIKF